VCEFAIESSEVSKTYRSLWGRRTVKALDGISLSVRRGSCFALVGPHGAGKTTFIKILCGSLRPDCGTVRIFGKPPGSAELQVHLTGHSFLASKARPTKLLLIDEPLRGMDAATRLRILDLIRERKSAGTTVLISASRISEVELVCDEVAILRAGKVMVSGPLAEFRIPRGFRMVVDGLPDHLQEELAASGFVVGLTGAACWIESLNRASLNPLIDRVRAAGVSIESVESAGPTLERYCST
jgi:ABC-type multidrug transport system ATPase subunit